MGFAFEGFSTDRRMRERMVLKSAFLALVDILQGTTRQAEVDPDRLLSLQSLGFQKWAYLVGAAGLEVFGRIFPPWLLSSDLQDYKTTPGLIQLNNQQESRQEWTKRLDAFVKSKTSSILSAEHAASGARPTGSTWSHELARGDFVCRPSPPPHVVDQGYLSQSDWTSSPLVFSKGTIKRENEDDSQPALDELRFLNPATMRLPGLSVVLRGLRTSSRPLVLDGEALQRVWSHGAAFVGPFFRGALVTSSTYRTDSATGLTDVAFVFAHPTHAYAAWASLPSWIGLVGLDDPVVLHTSDNWGSYHPLSAIKASAGVKQVKRAVDLQKPFLHPEKAAIADSVAIISLGETSVARVTYSSPHHANKMLGRKVIVTGTGGWPYKNAKYTEPLEAYHAYTEVIRCGLCGRLGHRIGECDVTSPVWCTATPTAWATRLGCIALPSMLSTSTPRLSWMQSWPELRLRASMPRSTSRS